MESKREIVKIENGDKYSWREALNSELWIAPTSNLFETEDAFFLNINLAGVERENIKISLVDGILFVFGRIAFHEAINKNYILKEAEVGNYFRKFRVAESVNSDLIAARYENGLLTIELPKLERYKTRIIKID